MADAFDNLADAARYASRSTGLTIEPEDLRRVADIGLLPEVPAANGAPAALRTAELDRFAGQVAPNPGEHDLFSGLQAYLGAVGGVGVWSGDAGPRVPDGELTFLRLGRAAGISFPASAPVVGTLQVFLTALRRRAPAVLNSALGRGTDGDHLLPIPLGEGVTYWGAWTVDEAVVRGIWDAAAAAEAALSPADVLTVPALYGNKSRMVRLLMGIVRNHVPAGGAVCDLMAGTGVVSHALGAEFDVFSNDANQYASVLTRWRQTRVTPDLVEAIRARIEGPFGANMAALEDLFADSLKQERHFLHAASTAGALADYRDFCASWPAYHTDGRAEAAGSGDPRVWGLIDRHRRGETATPHCLLAAFYGNAYFGLRQAAMLDSLRFAIGQLDDPISNEVALAALVMTAVSCASWAHFAQPPKLHTTQQMRRLVERRAKDAAAEFGLILELLAAPRRAVRLRAVWNLDWRGALANFADESAVYPPAARAVYVDPPYGKMQYSRYYHVLNTLVKYDYPVCSGIGRCPPPAQRFSSRFEFQPAVAARELKEVVDACADANLALFLSYSDHGFVSIDYLIGLFEARYRRALLYAARTRHHFQGRRRGHRRDQVREYVIVGTNS